MDYWKMSNEELYDLLRGKFPGARFKEIADYNRQTAIAILEMQEKEAKDPLDVQPEDK